MSASPVSPWNDQPVTVRQFAARRLTDISAYLILPIVLIQVAQRWHVPMVPVLLAIIAIGAGVTTVRWRNTRRVAVIPLIAMFVIVLLGATQFLSGSSILWDYRTTVAASFSGIICLVTLRFRRPMAFLVCRPLFGRGPGDRERFEERWQEPGFRHGFRLMTVVWAGAAFARAFIPLFFDGRSLAWDPFLVAHGLTVACTVGVLLWSVWYARRYLVQVSADRPAAVPG